MRWERRNEAATAHWMDERAVRAAGHRYVLCVEPQDGNGKAQMDNLPTRTDLARMLERFARTARADLKEMRGDE